MPDCAIFADTHSEPGSVYRHLAKLENLLPFPVYKVSNGSLKEKIGRKRPKGKWAHQPIPAFLAGPNGAVPVNRDCTRDFKIVPIQRKAKELAGITGKRAPLHPVVTQWIGISSDEASRMKPSRFAWCHHRFPLIEMNKSRGDCIEWMKRTGHPEPPKSACTFCPYHSNAMWRDLKVNDPDSWAEALEVDHKLQEIWVDQDSNKKMYLHNSLKPLGEIDFRNAEDKGQLNLFENECEGMCGV